MKALNGLSFAVVAVVALSLMSTPSAQLGTACGNDRSCTVVDLPSDCDMPTVSRPLVEVPKGQDRFIVKTTNVPGQTFMVFKCQDYVSGDCRTPLAGDDGKDLWLVPLPGTGTQEFKIRDTLAKCDNCEGEESGSSAWHSCVTKSCRYDYMVLNTHPHQRCRPPLDPMIIIDR